MTQWDYLEKHNNTYPFGSEHDTHSEIIGFMICDSDDEIRDDLKAMLELDGKEKLELFREFCIECNALPHIFSPDGTGIGDQMIQQY